MIISHSRKFIFVPIQKAASTTLRMELVKLCEPGDIVTPLDEDSSKEHSLDLPTTNGPFVDLHGRSQRLQNGENIRTIFDIFGDQVEDYLIIGCERNPYERLISRYLWQHLHGAYNDGTLASKAFRVGLLLEDHEAFQDYVRSSAHRLAEGHDRYSLFGSHVADFIVRQEHLAEDLERLAALLDVPGQLNAGGRFKAMPARPEHFVPARLFAGIEDVIREQFLRTFMIMGYRGPGSACPEFEPREDRHLVRRRYIDGIKGSSLAQGWRGRLRREHPGAAAFLLNLRYPGGR